MRTEAGCFLHKQVLQVQVVWRFVLLTEVSGAPWLCDLDFVNGIKYFHVAWKANINQSSAACLVELLPSSTQLASPCAPIPFCEDVLYTFDIVNIGRAEIHASDLTS